MKKKTKNGGLCQKRSDKKSLEKVFKILYNIFIR